MQTTEPRDPYNAALGAVRHFAQAGRFTPGEAIVVTELAAEVGLSATPVREALACLAGEGLIERRRGRGYFYPALGVADVIDLFELQLAYLHAALTLQSRGLAPLRKAADIDPVAGAQVLFDAIIAQSANSALILAHQRLTDRLAGVLRLEHRNNDADRPKVRAMIEAIADGRIADLLSLLQRHHEDRCARARRLLIDRTSHPDPPHGAGSAAGR